MPFADAQSLEELRELASRLQALAVRFRDSGLRLHYHSHEISRFFQGRCLMDWLLDLAPDLFWQVDVGWVTAGGVAVPAKLREWKERIALLHIKDIWQPDDNGPVQTQQTQDTQVQSRNRDGLDLSGGAPKRAGSLRAWGKGSWILRVFLPPQRSWASTHSFWKTIIPKIPMPLPTAVWLYSINI